MKKVALSLSFAIILLFPIAQAFFVKPADANPYRTDITYYDSPDSSEPSVALILQSGGPVYNVRNIAYAFTIVKPQTWTHNYLFSAQYFLDGRLVQVANQSSIEDPNNYADAPYHTPSSLGSQPLCLKGFIQQIPDGNHTVTFTVTCVSYYYPLQWRSTYFWWDAPPEELHYNVSSSAIDFMVDATPPTVSVFSIENNNYTSSKIPLTFSSSETAGQLSYCLDGLENVIITGNTTLTDLSNGPHTLTVYATDTAGNTGSSDIINFTIRPATQTETSSQQLGTFSVVLGAVLSAITVITVALALVVYMTKRKHRLN
jgi:hypothetical protein